MFISHKKNLHLHHQLPGVLPDVGGGEGGGVHHGLLQPPLHQGGVGPLQVKRETQRTIL